MNGCIWMSAQAAVSSKFQHILHTRHFTALVLFVFITPCLMLYISLMELVFLFGLFICLLFKKERKKKAKVHVFDGALGGGGSSFYLLHFHCSVVAWEELWKMLFPSSSHVATYEWVLVSWAPIKWTVPLWTKVGVTLSHNHTDLTPWGHVFSCSNLPVSPLYWKRVGTYSQTGMSDLSGVSEAPLKLPLPSQSACHWR